MCSSVGGLDLGLHRAGHETVLLCEVDPWRRQVLARHWPGVLIHHDLKVLRADDIPACDLLVGGTPCQDLSNAGRQAGLDGERSGLFWTFAQLRIDLYERHRCEWSLWENVAGSLSSNKGRDFAQVLSAHVGAEVAVPRRGWARSGGGHVVGPWGTAEWRLLDAQFFGVPQRRRRVFIVGHLGADVPSEVLADAPRVSRHPAPRRGPRPEAAAGPRRGAGRRRVTGALTARDRKGVDSDGSTDRLVVASALDCARGGVDDNDAQARHIVVAPTLRTASRPGSNNPNEVVAFHATQDPIASSAFTPALGTNMQVGVQSPAGVRRLTPTERERLMGWPDGWTYAHGPSLLDAPQGWPSADRSPADLRPDGRREAATGDGVVAHVAEWIGLGFAEAAHELTDTTTEAVAA